MARNLGMFGALLLLVIGAAFFYSRSLERGPIVRDTAPVELPQIVLEARDAMDRGELTRARELLETVKADNPAFLVAAQLLGLVHVREDDLDAAGEVLGRAMAIAPGEVGLHLDLSGVFYRQQKYADAEIAAMRALEMAPASAKAAYKVGLYRIAQGQTAGGIEAYHRAIAGHGAPADVEHGLAELAQLVADRPQLAAARYATAFLANTLGRDELELESLERFVELEPDGPIAAQARESLARLRSALAG